MTSRAKILGLVALLLAVGVAVATVLYASRNSDAPLPGFSVNGAPLVAAHAFAARDVAAIEIATGAESFRLERASGGWAVASKDGFPARQDRVAALMQNVLSATVLYDRRIQQTELSRFGLQPVTELGNSAVRISLRDGDDASLIDFRVGNVMSLPGGSDMETLIALPEEHRIAVLDRDLGLSWSSDAWLRRVDF